MTITAFPAELAWMKSENCSMLARRAAGGERGVRHVGVGVHVVEIDEDALGEPDPGQREALGRQAVRAGAVLPADALGVLEGVAGEGVEAVAYARAAAGRGAVGVGVVGAERRVVVEVLLTLAMSYASRRCPMSGVLVSGSLSPRPRGSPAMLYVRTVNVPLCAVDGAVAGAAVVLAAVSPANVIRAAAAAPKRPMVGRNVGLPVGRGGVWGPSSG
jgi:hypothetical protein